MEGRTFHPTASANLPFHLTTSISSSLSSALSFESRTQLRLLPASASQRFLCLPPRCSHRPCLVAEHCGPVGNPCRTSPHPEEVSQLQHRELLTSRLVMLQASNLQVATCQGLLQPWLSSRKLEQDISNFPDTLTLWRSSHSRLVTSRMLELQILTLIVHLETICP